MENIRRDGVSTSGLPSRASKGRDEAGAVSEDALRLALPRREGERVATRNEGPSCGHAGSEGLDASIRGGRRGWVKREQHVRISSDGRGGRGRRAAASDASADAVDAPPQDEVGR